MAVSPRRSAVQSPINPCREAQGMGGRSACLRQRADLVSLGFFITLMSASLAYGQVTMDVSKITCTQFARGEVGQPRSTAIWQDR